MSLAVQWCQSEAGGGSQGPVRIAGSLKVLHLGGRGSETSNWTTAAWMEALRQQSQPNSLGGAPAIGLKTRRGGGRPLGQRRTSWPRETSSQSSDSHVIVHYVVLSHSCFSAAVVSASICDQFVRIYVSGISLCFKKSCVSVSVSVCVFHGVRMCLCVSPCHIGCWRTDWAPGFLRFLSVEASDKGKCEVRRGLSVLTVCSGDGWRWMFEHQTDIKEQMAFMSSKIYPLNKLCGAPLADLWHLTHETAISAAFGCLAELPGTFTQRKHDILALFLKGFRILGRNWVSFSKTVPRKAIHFSLTCNSAVWKDRWQPGALLLGTENDKRLACRK